MELEGVVRNGVIVPDNGTPLPEGMRVRIIVAKRKTNGAPMESAASNDCLAVAMALAQDLGPQFSSENSHDLAERGTDWFAEP
jgi:hypothetical protein